MKSVIIFKELIRANLNQIFLSISKNSTILYAKRKFASIAVNQFRCVINVEPLEGFGVRMLFEGFFISPDDTLTIKTTVGEFT